MDKIIDWIANLLMGLMIIAFVAFLIGGLPGLVGDNISRKHMPDTKYEYKLDQPSEYAKGWYTLNPLSNIILFDDYAIEDKKVVINQYYVPYKLGWRLVTDSPIKFDYIECIPKPIEER